MTDAPERIWVEPDYDHGWSYPRGNWSITHHAPHVEEVEYVRADTITELREELREARELLADAIEDSGEFETDWNKAARAFLAKTQPKGTDE